MKTSRNVRVQTFVVPEKRPSKSTNLWYLIHDISRSFLSKHSKQYHFLNYFFKLLLVVPFIFKNQYFYTIRNLYGKLSLMPQKRYPWACFHRAFLVKMFCIALSKNVLHSPYYYHTKDDALFQMCMIILLTDPTRNCTLSFS